MNIQPPSGGLHLPFIKTKNKSGTGERRLPGFEWLPNKVRNHFIAMMGEFSGTFLFLFFAFSATQVANAATSGAGMNTTGGISQTPNTSSLLYISLAFGFSLAVNAWVFFRISGGLFNPAVSQVRNHSSCVLTLAGHPRNVSDRSCSMASRAFGIHIADSRIYGGRRCLFCTLPWATQRLDCTRRRYLDCTRTVHRNVPDCPACLHHLHAGSRKTQGHIYRSNWNWSFLVHR